MFPDRSRAVSFIFAVLYGTATLALALTGLFLLMGLYRSLFVMVLHFFELSKQELMQTSLALIELTLICFLILLFTHAAIMRTYFQALLRGAFLIVLMATLVLLQKLLDIGNQSLEQLLWSIALYGAFLVTAIALFVLERLGLPERANMHAKKFIQ